MYTQIVIDMERGKWYETYETKTAKQEKPKEHTGPRRGQTETQPKHKQNKPRGAGNRQTNQTNPGGQETENESKTNTRNPEPATFNTTRQASKKNKINYAFL